MAPQRHPGHRLPVHGRGVDLVPGRLRRRLRPRRRRLLRPLRTFAADHRRRGRVPPGRPRPDPGRGRPRLRRVGRRPRRLVGLRPGRLHRGVPADGGVTGPGQGDQAPPPRPAGDLRRRHLRGRHRPRDRGPQPRGRLRPLRRRRPHPARDRRPHPDGPIDGRPARHRPPRPRPRGPRRLRGPGAQPGGPRPHARPRLRRVLRPPPVHRLRPGRTDGDAPLRSRPRLLVRHEEPLHVLRPQPVGHGVPAQEPRPGARHAQAPRQPLRHALLQRHRQHPGPGLHEPAVRTPGRGPHRPARPLRDPPQPHPPAARCHAPGRVSPRCSRGSRASAATSSPS